MDVIGSNSYLLEIDLYYYLGISLLNKSKYLSSNLTLVVAEMISPEYKSREQIN